MGKRRYKLRYLPLFWDDLNSAVTYISEVLKNPRAAERLLDDAEAAILEKLENLTFAAVYQGRPEGRTPYYWFPVGNYMVFYVVEDDVMEVRRFLHGARDLTKVRL